MDFQATEVVRMRQLTNNLTCFFSKRTTPASWSPWNNVWIAFQSNKSSKNENLNVL
jgi:hypothetical protein